MMRATVQCKMQYGLHIASSTVKTAKLRLEQQNKTMRIVAGAAMPTCDSLTYWLGVRNVRHQQRYQAARDYLRAATSPS